MKKIIIFDFDGTIADTRPIILKSFHGTFDAMNLPQHSDEEIAATIGLPLVKAFPILSPMCEEKAEQCTAVYRKIFEKINQKTEVLMFPHVSDTLKNLHDQGSICTIATSRGEDSVKDFIKAFGLSDIITYVIAAENVKQAKPNPEPVNKTLTHFNIKPEDAAVVGDTHFDILMGNNAGCLTIGVSYGYGSRESLIKAGAGAIIDDMEDLTELLM